MSALSFISGTGSLQYTSVFATDLNANTLSLRELKADTITIDNLNGVSNGLYIRSTSVNMSGTNIALSAQNIYLIGTVETISTENFKIADPVIQLNSGNAAISGGLILMSGTAAEYGRIQAVTSGALYGMEFTGGISTGTISASYTRADNVTVTSATFNTISCASASICDLGLISSGVKISAGIVNMHTGSSVAGVTMRLSDDLLYISCLSMPKLIGTLSTLKLEADVMTLRSDNYSTLATNDIGYSFGTGVVTVSLTTAYSSFLSTFATITVPAGVWGVTVYGSVWQAIVSDDNALEGLQGVFALTEVDILSSPSSMPLNRKVRIQNICRGISTPVDNYCMYVENLSTSVTYYLRAYCIVGRNDAINKSATFSTRADFTRLA